MSIASHLMKYFGNRPVNQIEADDIESVSFQTLDHCRTDKAKTYKSDITRHAAALSLYLSIASITSTQARQIPSVKTKPTTDCRDGLTMKSPPAVYQRLDCGTASSSGIVTWR